MVERELVAWVVEQIRVSPPGTRLPSERALAREFGLAKATVERALRPLRDNGQLVRQVGKGTFTAGATREPVLPHVQSSSQSVEAGLSGLVTSGAVRAGTPLPSVKELCVQFGVSRTSVTQAIDRMVARGLATRIGRNVFAGPDFETVLGSVRHGRFHLFLRGEPDFGRIYRSDFLAPAFQSMERVLLAHGGSLHYHSTAELSDLSNSWRRNKDLPAGLLFARVEKGTMAESLRHVEPLVGDRRRAHTRVVCDVRTGEFAPLRRVGEIISRGHINTIAARRVARFVGTRNLSRVRFYFDMSQEMWDYRDPAWPIVKLRAELGSLPVAPKFSFHLFGEGKKMNFDALFTLPSMADTVEKRLSKHRSILLKDLRKEVSFDGNADAHLRDHTDADLWVFSSARLAAQGLAVARDRGIRVPGNLSILCLEDDPHYYHLGISYCGPDFDRIGYLMAHCLLGDMTVSRSSQGLVTAAALLVNKQTTRA